MLEGIEHNDIIVGAYVDRRGGVCPMLAAHRCGGRTDFLAFAHAWDTFTQAKRVRRASEREIGVLVAYLKASLLADEPHDLGVAVAAHQRAVRRRREREAASLGLGWLRRAERDAEAALEQLDDVARDALAHEGEHEDGRQREDAGRLVRR